MFLVRSGILLLVFCCACSCIHGADPNKDDFATAPVGGWAAVTATTSLPYETAAGKYGVVTTKRVHAQLGLIASHVKDSTGTARPHVHHEKDYDDFGRQADADRFYDHIFGAAGFNPPKTTRKSNATNETNCHAYCLGRVGRAGSAYTKWTDPSTAPFNADTEAKLKASVATNDVLWYGNSHSTFVHAAANNVIQKLRWKAGFSGVYEMSTAGFDTPKRPVTGVNGSGYLIWGSWDPDLMGKEANLVDGKVRRKKP